MPILDLQRRLHELGRIRIGERRPTSGGKSRPAKLEVFRLTSRDRRAIDAAAAVYGGEPQKWAGPDGVQQWEVYTSAAEMAVVVPPEDLAFSQFYELWSGGGCQRRCDGRTEFIADQPCVCNPADRECDTHTRLSVILRDIPGLGVWRLDTQGWYAATELRGAVDVLAATTAVGRMLPARLRLEQRSVMRPGQPRRDFAVPVLEIDVAFHELQSLAGSSAAALPTAEPPAAIHERRQELPAARPAEPKPEPKPEPVKPQVAQPRGRRRAPAIPATSVQPRTAAEAKAGDPPRRLITGQQRGHIFPILRDNGLGEERDRVRALHAYEVMVGRKVESTKDLTMSEASAIITAWERMDIAFSRHELNNPQDRLTTVAQITARDDLDSPLAVTPAEAKLVVETLDRVPPPQDARSFDDFISDLAVTLLSDIAREIDIDPETGEAIPPLDQPALDEEP